MNLLLDTDVLIYFLRGDKRVRALLECNDQFSYSYITRKELLKKPGLSSRERDTIAALLTRLRQQPIDGKIASLADRLWRTHRHQGLAIPDALIAATAIVRKAILVTFNRKHFRFIDELALFPIEKLRK